ncbi:MAG: 2-hydroxyacyl-CoA dehydratase [Euryarchaeota archaeon]|nr:2-hydroxyacyl-CoA dehydratase [Euryarchaeota archaeon]
MIGITALVPPEVLYASGKRPLDLNNLVPESKINPREKLCAWTAIWRELVIHGGLDLEGLVVVAGGDCHNAIVDGEKVELSGLPTCYFLYPFDGSPQLLEAQLEDLVEFLGGIKERSRFEIVRALKKRALALDKRRVRGEVAASDGFLLQVSTSDMLGSLEAYEERLGRMEASDETVEFKHRIALLGVPPIYPDLHAFLQSLGLHVVYDEMPYEFIRLTGSSLSGISRSYAGYTFAGKIQRRLGFIEKELKRRRVDAVIHFQQFACHHRLEDPIMRERLNRGLGYPYLGIEGDMPSKLPEQVKLRLEAFAERLGD